VSIFFLLFLIAAPPDPAQPSRSASCCLRGKVDTYYFLFIFISGFLVFSFADNKMDELDVPTFLEGEAGPEPGPTLAVQDDGMLLFDDEVCMEPVDVGAVEAELVALLVGPSTPAHPPPADPASPSSSRATPASAQAVAAATSSTLPVRARHIARVC
jgi:hypothetical protein